MTLYSQQEGPMATPAASTTDTYLADALLVAAYESFKYGIGVL